MDIDDAPTPRRNSIISEVSECRPPPIDSERTSEALGAVKDLVVGSEDLTDDDAPAEEAT